MSGRDAPRGAEKLERSNLRPEAGVVTLKVGSLFSGVGGFEMGFEWAGFETAWQVEIDRDAVSVLDRHWPAVTRYRDVRDVDPADLEPVDVVIFGSPCQDFSVAGKRAGLAGERSGLFGEAVRIIRELRPGPSFCVWENVPGAFSSVAGRDFGSVLDALADCGALDIAWRVLDAQWFGIPQRRRRIFLVADFGSERAGQVLFEPPSGGRHLEARGTAGQGTAGDAADGAGVVGTVRSHPRPGSSDVGTLTMTGDGVAHAVTCHAAKGGDPSMDNYVPVLSGCLDAQGTRTGQAANTGQIVALPYQQPAYDVHPCLAAGTGGPGSQDYQQHAAVIEVASSVTASAGHHGHSSPRGDGADNLIVGAVAFNWQTGGDFRPCISDDATSALHSSQTPAVAIFDELNASSRANRTQREFGSTANSLHTDGLSVITPMAVRRLTPTECCRLMGWPDDHVRYRADGSLIPDGTQYRLIGNGVVAPVAYWIARRLRAALEAS